MFRFLNSKKGFTVVELAVALIILGILCAIAIPVFGAGLKKQKQNECANQRTVIATAFEQVMYGMVDNGKKQETVRDVNGDVVRYALNFAGDIPQADHKAIYPAVAIKDDDGIGVKDNAYEGKECFVLCKTQQIAGKQAFTIGDIRGGYRDKNNVPDYRVGCERGNYLKKEGLKDEPFYEYLDNQEIPICPFADFEDDDTTNDYYYHILWDTTTDSLVVLCSCPQCNEADD